MCCEDSVPDVREDEHQSLYDAFRRETVRYDGMRLELSIRLPRLACKLQAWSPVLVSVSENGNENERALLWEYVEMMQSVGLCNCKSNLSP